MSEIFAEQLTAAANVVLAVFAIVTAFLAGLAFRKQSREVSDQAAMLDLQRRQLAEQEKTSAEQARVLKLQAEELQASLGERRREAEERRRGQAVMVYMWETRSRTIRPNGEVQGTVYTFVRNTSDQPVYDLRFRWHNGDRSLDEELLGEPLRPGDTNRAHTTSRGAVPDDFGAVVIFRDRAGIWWKTAPDGHLEETSRPEVILPGQGARLSQPDLGAEVSAGVSPRDVPDVPAGSTDTRR